MTEHPNAERLRRARTREWLIAAVLVPLVGVPCLVYGFLVPRALHREHNRPNACLSNERQSATALLTYAEDHDERLPPADRWCDVLVLAAKPRSLFLCPSRKCEQSGYWLNSTVAGTDVRAVTNADTLILTFEGEDGWNRVGGPGDEVHPHNGGANLTFVDGHAKWVGPGTAPKPLWLATPARPAEPLSPDRGAARLSERRRADD